MNFGRLIEYNKKIFSFKNHAEFVCFPSCEVMNFEINLIFLIKPFFCMTKMSRQKFKYLEKKQSF